MASEKRLDVISFDGSVLVLAGESGSRELVVMYMFDADRLIAGGIAIMKYHQNLDEYENDYGDIVSQVNETHGQYTEKSETWADDSPYNIANPPPSRGVAVMLGMLSSRAEWRTDRSAIVAKLWSADYVPIISLSFARQ